MFFMVCRAWNVAGSQEGWRVVFVLQECSFFALLNLGTMSVTEDSKKQNKTKTKHATHNNKNPQFILNYVNSLLISHILIFNALKITISKSIISSKIWETKHEDFLDSVYSVDGIILEHIAIEHSTKNITLYQTNGIHDIWSQKDRCIPVMLFFPP